MNTKSKILALLLVMVLVVFGVFATSCDDNKDNGDNNVAEYPEAGVYASWNTLDRCVLVLQEGGNFTIAYKGLNDRGSYTLAESALTLTLDGDKGNVDASYAQTAITLVYGGDNLTLYKMIDYTVSFEVNGGSAVANQSVTNGSRAAAPADPTRYGYAFLGWYADASFTAKYDFATPVTGNVTVYAKWTEKAEGQVEYTVNFVGADLPAAQTIGGKLVELPVPTKDGYTFGGWWTSMYEDGEKLTAAYTEGTVLTADTTLYAVWYETGATKLPAPGVSVSVNKISWNAVNGATGYKLTVIGPDGNAVIDNETVGTTTKTIDFASMSEGDYKITVVAVAGNADNNSAEAVRYYANKALDKVTTFHVENGILIFGAVKNAEKYTLNISCGNASHNHTAVDNGLSTTYYLSNCTMQPGGILITVTASAAGYAPSTSKVYSYEKSLAAVGGVAYDAATDTVTWNPVAGAANYKVIVTIGDTVHVTDNGTFTSFSTANYSGEFTVSVVPETDGCNSPEATSVNVTKTAPAAPTNIQFNGMNVTWTAVAGATSYEVNIGGQTAIVNTNSINLTTLSTPLTQGKTYNVKIKAFNENNEGSSYSETVKIGYNVFESTLTYNKGTVSWSPVLTEDGKYEVRVNGGSVKVVRNAYSASVTLTKDGDNLIEVRFVSDTYESEWMQLNVTAYTVEFDTRSLNGILNPVYVAYGDVIKLPSVTLNYEGFDFAGWYTAPKGNGKACAAGDTFTGNSYTVLYANWTPKVYNITLDLAGLDITNIKQGDQAPVSYTMNYTLPVPTHVDAGVYQFVGWFAGPYGQGEQFTDETGASVAPYSYTKGLVAYPYFTSESLVFEIQSDGTYGVKAGPEIGSINELKIPVTFNGIEVTRILEKGFLNCYSITSVKIPDNIKLVGLKAFRGAVNLQSIEMYVAYPENVGNYENDYYETHEGALLRNDMGTKYLEVVPQGMTGTYTIPAGVQNILENAFYNSSLTGVVISTSVVSIPKNAFYNCQSLKVVEFEYGRVNALTLGEEAFYLCDAVESIKIPANLELELNVLAKHFDAFPKLMSIEVEAGSKNYASIGGILTNATQTTILYAPKSFVGSYTIPEGVTTVGKNAFNGRNSVTAVTIPTWVTKIEEGAFANANKIQTVTFASGRTDDLTIETLAFAYHRNLTSITFEDAQTNTLDSGKITIGDSAFTASTSATYRSLTAINVGAGTNITAIGNYAFANNSKLLNINVDVAASVKTIGQYAFANCSMLTKVKIPATVTLIDQYAFAENVLLTEIAFDTVGATVLDIADYAFYGCEKLGAVTLPDHLNTFRSSAFDGCELLKQINVNTTNPNYLSDANGILYKKNTDADGNPVLAELLFYPKGLAKELNGIVNNLPNTLTTIGGAAFSNNIYLVNVIIPASVTLIDDSAFANCANLRTLTFEQGGTSLVIGQYAFENCSELSDDFALPAYTTEIGSFAFKNCDFTKFTIPASVSYIGSGAFYNCDMLKNVVFNTNVTLTIGAETGATPELGVFSGCKNLESIKLPAKLTSLGQYTFYGCTSLTTVELGTTTLENGVYSVDSELEKICDYAFYGCTALQSIVIPNTVTNVGVSAFEMYEGKSSALTEVHFELGGTAPLTVENLAFKNASSLTVINFPARVSLMTEVNYSTGAKSFDTIDTAWTFDASKFSTSATYAAQNGRLPYLTKDIFSGCTSLAEINVAGESVEGQKFSSLDGVLYNADKTVLIFCPVANVGRYVDGTATKEIRIPTSVQLVASYAFYNNTKLETVTFDEFATTDANYGTQLLTIGNASGAKWEGAYFSAIGGNTSSITTINLPSHLSTVNANAFGNKSSNAVSINVSPASSNITLGNYAFDYSRATSLKFPSIKYMGNNTFSNCLVLADLTIDAYDASISAIPQRMLYMNAGTNTSLTKFVIPEQITVISSSAFFNCSALEDVTVHNKVTSIGADAFGHTAIKSVTLPVTLGSTGLSASAFYCCYKLTDVTFELVDGVSPINKIQDSTFYGCISLKNINLEDLNLTSIGGYSFQNCKALTTVDFTKFTNLTTIGNSAFSGSGIVVADLSKTQIKALSNAFNACASLTTLLLPDTVTTISSPYTNIPALETLRIGVKTPAAQIIKLQARQLQTLVVPEGHDTLIKENGVVYDTAKQNIYFADRGADLTNYVIPSTVTAISNYAFYGAKLGDLVIPEGVKTIGQYAFAFSTIKSVSLPATLTTINNYAFSASALENVNFSDSAARQLKTIGQYVFNKTNLVSIVIPDSVTTLNSYALANCSKLTSVTFGGNMTTLNSGIVQGCTNLETIVIQNKVTTINAIYQNVSSAGGSYASNKVTSLTIPASVTNIANSAFAAFGKLETVTFASGSKLTSIGNFAFYGAESLKSFTVPSKVTSIGTHAFYNATSLKTFDMSQSGISTLSQEALYNTTSLESVVFNGKISTIGKAAFGNTALTEITIPATVTTIATGAFENSALKTVTFTHDSAMKALGSDTNTGIFKGTANLETLVIPNSLTSIGVSAFENSGLKQVALTDPDSLAEIKTVGKYAFAGCANLTQFDYLNAATYIGDYAFMNCSKLAKADLAEGLTTLGIMAFAFCDNLESAYIPSSVIDIKGNPFGGLDKSKISIGEANDLYTLVDENGVLVLYDIDEMIVYGVYGAEGDYTIADDVFAAAPGAFAGTDITSISVPKRFGVIYEAMFMNCAKLESIEIENGISEFCEYAFYGTGLKTIEIPESVTYLAAYSISNNPVINDIVIPANVLELGKGVFANNTSLSNVSFEFTEDWIVLNSHTFYGCTSLKQVVLPAFYKANKEAMLAESGMAATASGLDVSLTYGLLGYTFANTGIVNAYVPVVHYMYNDPIFSGCEDLETITFGTSFTYKHNTTWPVKTNLMYEGCDNLRAVYFDSVGGERASSTKYSTSAVEYDGNLNNFNLMVAAGVKEFHVDHIDFTHYNSSGVKWNMTNGEEVNIYFDNNTYEDIVEFFRYCKAAWNVNIFDKDGNRLVCDDDSGIIGSVVNAEGETLWTNTATGAEVHPDDSDD